jgi:hypothetical protein
MYPSLSKSYLQNKSIYLHVESQFEFSFQSAVEDFEHAMHKLFQINVAAVV